MGVLGMMPSKTSLPVMAPTKTESGLTTDFNIVAEEDDDDAFERAVELIKKYETLHTVAHWPYIGYGHRVKKGESFARRNLSEKEADELLRKDLKEYVALFSDYEEDALMLGVLAYSVGPYRLLGAGKRAKSELLKKLENGNRDIRNEYLAFSKYRGRHHKGLHKRRTEEFEMLYAG